MPMERKARHWSWMAALAGALVALVLFLPARWLAGPLLSVSQSHVRLVNVSGTIWNGHADILLSGGEGSRSLASLPGGLSWRLRPGLKPVLRMELSAPCCTAQPLQIDLQPGWGGAALHWHAGRMRWPTELLAGLGTPWNTLALEGRMDIETSGLTVGLTQGRVRMTGAVVIQAHDLSSRMATLRPLGSYRIELNAADGGGTPQVELSTLRGDLKIAGTGQWVAGRLRFRGEASASPGREAALANLLNIIGRRQGARSVINLG